jgi:hypothetical protein
MTFTSSALESEKQDSEFRQEQIGNLKLETSIASSQLLISALLNPGS